MTVDREELQSDWDISCGLNAQYAIIVISEADLLSPDCHPQLARRLAPLTEGARHFSWVVVFVRFSQLTKDQFYGLQAYVVSQFRICTIPAETDEEVAKAIKKFHLQVEFVCSFACSMFL